MTPWITSPFDVYPREGGKNFRDRWAVYIGHALNEEENPLELCTHQAEYP
jgi:hypothetical protein